MRVTPTELDDVVVIEPRVFPDNRGFFYELFQGQRFSENGLPQNFVQNNFSHSVQNVIRGLHYQLEQPQGKLIFVVYGEVVDVIVDIRQSSKNFGKSIAIKIAENKPQQIYIPPGFAHGFCVLSESAGFVYQCTDYYHPTSEYGILWNDPDLKIDWPVLNPIISSKDQALPHLKDIPSELLPK